jgi:Flavin-binding monooxygenase-like
MKWGDTEAKYLIVGAGPTGLAAAHAFLKLDIPFCGIEASHGVGGLWDISNPKSTMYQTAHLISSRTTTEFSHFPMTNTQAMYPKHTEVKDYLDAFASRFKIRDYFLFNTTLLHLEQTEKSWHATFNNGEKHLFKGIVICSGILSEPLLPRYKGEFTGELIHSAAYKNPTWFAGKRVLIVGGGNSGCDIAVDAVHHAVSVDWSLRRGYHFMPKFVFGKPIDTLGKKWMPQFLKMIISKLISKAFIGKIQHFGLQEPDHQLYQVHPILNSLVIHHLGHGDITPRKDIDFFMGKTVHFTDGQIADYDAIICCTGYKIHYPFIAKEHLNWQGTAPNLFLNIFPPQLNNVFVLGMVEAAGLGWQGKYEQALLVANYIKNVAKKGAASVKFDKAKQENNTDLSGGLAYKKLERMAYYVHKDTYRKKIQYWTKFLE